MSTLTDMRLWQRAWFKVAAFVLFWTLIGLCFGLQYHISMSGAGMLVTWWHDALRPSLVDWYSFALLSIPIARLARRWPLIGAHWTRNVWLQLLFSVLASLLYAAFRLLLDQLINPSFQPLPELFQSYPELFQNLLPKTFLYNILVYWVILVVAHALSYSVRIHEQEVQAAELKQKLTEAKLQALQMQLNPHFLFNTLHSISTLVHTNPASADRMIVRLGELLRHTLESTETQEVTLEAEVAFLQRYLDIEKIRFGSRLEVRIQIPERLARARVPNLVLQPIVENAIKHGIERRAGGGTIDLSADEAGGILSLEVRDNGVGLKEKGREGVGLSNTRKRMQQLYRHEQSLELTAGAAGGTLARLTMPFRTD